MSGVISGRDVVIVVASVLIGGGVTCEDGLGDEKSMTGAITGGVDVKVIMNLWVGCSEENSSSMSSAFGPASGHMYFSRAWSSVRTDVPILLVTVVVWELFQILDPDSYSSKGAALWRRKDPKLSINCLFYVAIKTFTFSPFSCAHPNSIFLVSLRAGSSTFILEEQILDGRKQLRRGGERYEELVLRKDVHRRSGKMGFFSGTFASAIVFCIRIINKGNMHGRETMLERKVDIDMTCLDCEVADSSGSLAGSSAYAGFSSFFMREIRNRGISLEDPDKEEEQELHRQDSLQVEGRIGALGKLFSLYQKEDGRGDQ
ncbi:hypothetical protein Tco_0313265 [Tanacetum coccineum]